MNEEVFFKTADYTKNRNLVMDDNTIYEMDPVCVAKMSGQKKDYKDQNTDAFTQSPCQISDNIGNESVDDLEQQNNISSEGGETENRIIQGIDIEKESFSLHQTVKRKCNIGTILLLFVLICR